VQKADIIHFTVSSIASYVNTLVRLLAGVVTGWILLHYFTKEEYGTYKFIFSVSTMMLLVTSFGMSSVFSRYIPEFIERKHRKSLKKLLCWGITIRLTSVSIILLFGFLFRDAFIRFFSCPTLFVDSLLAIIALLFLLKTEEILGPAILASFLDHAKIAIIQIIKTVGQVAIILLVFLYFRAGFREIIISYIFLEIAIVLITLVFTTQSIKQNFKKIGHSAGEDFHLRRIFRFGGYSYFQSTIGVFRDVAVDNMIIAHYLGMEAVAVYSFAYMLTNFLDIANPIKMLKTQISFWLVRKYTAVNDLALFQQQFRFTSILTLCTLIPCTAFLILFRSEIIAFFNRSYPEVELLIILFVLFIIAQGLRQSYGFAFIVLERVEYRFYANIFSVYNLIANIIFLKLWGVTGVVLATSSASLFTLFYFDYIWRTRLGFSPCYYMKGIGRILLNSGIALAASFTLSFFLSDFELLIVGAVIFGIMYMGLTLLFTPIHQDDLQLLERFIPEKFKFILNYCSC